MICDKCKTEVSEAAKFCPKCGAKIDTAVIQDAQPDAEASQPASSPGSAEGDAAAAPSEVKHAEVPPVSAPRLTPSQPAQQEGQKSSKGLLVAIIVLALVVIAGAGGYLFFSGPMGKTPAKLGEQINNELKGKGLNLYCEIDNNWTATLKGSTKSAAEKDTAMGIVRAHKEVKDVRDEVQTQMSPSDLKLAVDNALLAGGFVDVLSDVDENLVATLHGTVASENEKTEAVRVAKAVDKVKDVKDNIQVQASLPPAETASKPPLPAGETKQKRRDTARSLQEPRQKGRETARPTQEPMQRRSDVARPYEGPKGLYGDAQTERRVPSGIDPYELEVKINRALHDAGFNRVRARVGERLNVFLNGRVVNEARRAKAIEIAKSFTGVRNVYDKMVVGGN